MIKIKLGGNYLWIFNFYVGVSCGDYRGGVRSGRVLSGKDAGFGQMAGTDGPCDDRAAGAAEVCSVLRVVAAFKSDDQPGKVSVE